MNVKDTVLNTIEKQKLISEGEKILVAVSGGSDSVCLLDVLNCIKDVFNIKLFVAHLNHSIRGKDADNDEKFVKDLSEKYGFKFYSKRVDVPEFAKTFGLSLEEAGRILRYEFFDEIKKKEKIDKIVTAHNKNDRAETIVMRIFRGSGSSGLKGISYKRSDGVIRPLLDVLKDDIEKYCAENGLEYCFDKTNSDNDYTRNRIRNELLPYVKENFNSNIIDTLIRFSEISSADSDFLDAYTVRLLDRLNTPAFEEKKNSINIETLNYLDYSIKSRLVILMSKKVMGEDLKLSYKNITDILNLTENETGTGIDLPNGLRVQNNYGWLDFVDKNEFINMQTENSDFFIEVKPLNSYFIESIDRNISLKLVDPKIYKKKLNEILIDFDKLESEKLFIRNRIDGDRIAYFSDGRTKKIKSIFIDDKIEKKDRNKIPLLCTEKEVIAIIGSRVSSKYKITKETGRALAVEYGKN